MNTAQATGLLLAALAFPPALYAQAPRDGELAALSAAVERVTPQFAGRVEFRLAELPAPRLSAEGGKLVVSAATRSECMRAYGYYLRELAGVHLSWNGDNAEHARLVLPEKPVEVPRTRAFNLAFNYCTLCYSGAHWDRERWAQELDRLALAGYKYMPVFSGLEAVWQEFLTGLGCPQEQVQAFIANPAYSAWWLMGNLEGEGGPVHPDIIRQEAELGRFIVQRMRELGMEPVLQGYVGFLPHDMDPAAVDGQLLPQGEWVAGYRRPAVLDPSSPDFPKLAARWYELLEKHYGYRAKAFGGDLFHEGGKPGKADLEACGRAVQKAMQKASPGSYWMLQAWAQNPLKKLLAGLDRDHTLILLLDKDPTPEHDPYYRTHKSLKRPQVDGFPLIWCELSNFGGKQGLYGSLPLLENFCPESGGHIGKMAEDCVGIGLLSEGVETNPLYYALLTRRVNQIRNRIDRPAFLGQYAAQRYGVEDSRLVQALSLLASSVYAPTGMREGSLENLLCARPSLTAESVTTWSDPRQYYTPATVERAAQLMLQAGRARPALAEIPTFRYDLATVLQQVLGDRARALLPCLEQDYRQRDTESFSRHAAGFKQLLEQSADALATTEHYLLGCYEQGAANKGGTNPEARAEMRRTLRRMLSTWAKGNTSLNDYAHRHFSEMMRCYYLPRWSVFLDKRLQELRTGTAQDVETESESVSNNGEDISRTIETDPDIDRIQDAFPTAEIPLLTAPQGNILDIAGRILGK